MSSGYSQRNNFHLCEHYESTKVTNNKSNKVINGGRSFSGGGTDVHEEHRTDRLSVISDALLQKWSKQQFLCECPLDAHFLHEKNI